MFTSHRTLSFFLAIWSSAFLLSGTSLHAEPDDVTPPGLGEFIRQCEVDHRAITRFYDVPWSQSRFERRQQLHRDWLKRLEQLDFSSLSQPARIDYLLLRNWLRGETAEDSIDQKHLAEMADLLPFRQQIENLERARWRMSPLDPQTNATLVANFKEQVKKLRARIDRGRKEKKKDSKDTEPKDKEAKDTNDSKDKEATAATQDPDAEAGDKAKHDEKVGPPLKPTPLVAKRAAAAVTELRAALKTWYSFYDGYQPDFTWWVQKPYEEAAKALEDYARFLREEVAGIKGKDEDPLRGEPVGADVLAEQIRLQMLPYSAEELIRIGEKEFAWCEKEMKKAARELGFGDDWKAALESVKAEFVPPGKQDQWVSESARDAIAFVKQHDLLTVPPLCEETWRVTVISADGQKTLPYAAYGGQNIMVAYARAEMNQEDKLMSMRGNNRHFTRIVTAHELIPGHHLQAFQAARHRSYRSTFSTPFFVEGWALYWELRLWEMNYARSPKERIGMLFWRMHRTARIIVSLKFHLEQMKPQEMVDFLVERVGHERMGATSEVRRFIGGGYSPLYQAGYMIGGLQLLALRREAVESGKMTDRAFNDAVLTYGPIPVELIRVGLLQVAVTPETESSWKFYEGAESKSQ